MKDSSFFDRFNSQNDRINIRLENFEFFHRPITDDLTEPNDFKYIEKPNPVHQLRNWITGNVADSGSYLITGYRGAGKSSFVGKLLKELQQEEKKTHVKYVPLSINFGQENIEEAEILHILAKRLLGKLLEQNPIMRLYYAMKHYLALLTGLFILAVLFAWYILGKDNIYTYLFLAAIILALIATQICAGLRPEVRAIVKLRNLVQRLNASVQVESGGVTDLEWNGLKSPIKDKHSRNIQPASPQEIEYDLIEILDLMKSGNNNRKVVIIFDELDKTDSTRRLERSDRMPEFEKLSIRPEQKVSSRTRKQEVLRVIANMKFFLSSAKACFIFIAGREMYEAYQADMSDRDFSISSIFNGVINIDSFLTSSRDTNDTNRMAEQFVCKQLFPQNIENHIRTSRDTKYDRKNIHCLKNYYRYRLEERKDYEDNERTADGKADASRYEERVWRDVLFLYHFISYLSYISNGSPKKMTLFFEKNIRKGDYLAAVKKYCLYKREDNKWTAQDLKEYFFLSFGYYTQEKVNFIHYLTYPIMQSIINRSNLYGDKLLVSSSFLISHIFKLHNNGFSWRNLEQTPELLEINKTPEIREYIGSIIDFMNHTHLTTIACGLFHYKFPMRISEEISYHSKISGEVSSIFNFSLDEMQCIKEHYERVLKYSGRKENATDYAQASIHHSLGDIFMLEENYSDAIREYEKCVESVAPMLKKAGSNDVQKEVQLLNYISFLNRTMLKLGLAHEKRRTDNSAFIVYEELIQILKSFSQNASALLSNMRTLHLSLLVRLYALEKIDTTGIQYKHLEETCDNFTRIFGEKPNPVIAADFYRKLGDILYYKNQQFCKAEGTPYTAKEFYIRSLCLLLDLDLKRLPFRTANQRCLYLYRQALDIKKRLETPACVNEQTATIRDNYIYHMALTLENLGHIELSGCQGPYSYHADFLEMFKKTIINTDKHADLPLHNNMERAMLYYWTASRLYTISCERSLSTKCYREIAYSLFAYIQNLNDGGKRSVRSTIVLELVRDIGTYFLISQYRQYEHVNLSEMDVLQWMKGQEMFCQPASGDLSVSPDIEELIYIYYNLKLYLYSISDGAVRGTLAEDLKNFYQSGIMTGKHPCSTLTSTIQNLKLKAKYNEWMLAAVLGCPVAGLDNVRFSNISRYLDEQITDPLVLTIFPEVAGTNKDNILGDKLDLLEFLIVDGLFCLSRVEELVTPLRNTTLFNNSFKAGIYLHLLRLTYLYKLVYCYYHYGSNEDDDEQIGNFLKELNIPEPSTVSKPHGNYANRRDVFFKKVMKATHKGSPANIHLPFLAENAIHYFTKARQLHFQGKAYQATIRNLFFLDDDLNNDTLQFYIALERFNIASGVLYRAEQELKSRYNHNPVYRIDEYFAVAVTENRH